ncbi:MAG: hypothetical protein H0U89_05050, partial [Acidimicrobiia bacterium]|nr:hypothetical protein [Acidimicrobiia bacterium]
MTRPPRGAGSAEDERARARRTAALLGTAGQVWPWWLERLLDPASPAFVALPGDVGVLPNVTGRSWTRLGTRGGSSVATVDPGGLVTPAAGGWSLDWWVGADDRWHLPSREVAVRQRAVDGAPVVETAMRVPGGDIVATAWAVPWGDAPGTGSLVVLEVANDTPVPVALALAVRPYDPEGASVVGSVALVDDVVVTVDGRPALVLPRPPARVAAASLTVEDPLSVVVGGKAGPASSLPPGGVRCREGLAAAAFLVPLTHRTSVRVVLPLGAVEPRRRRARPPLPTASSLPPSSAVVAGWRSHLAVGTRVDVPDERLATVLGASRSALLLGGVEALGLGPQAAVAGALDRLGHHA